MKNLASIPQDSFNDLKTSPLLYKIILIDLHDSIKCDDTMFNFEQEKEYNTHIYTNNKEIITVINDKLSNSNNQRIKLTILDNNGNVRQTGSYYKQLIDNYKLLKNRLK